MKPVAYIDRQDLERLPHQDCWVNGQEHKNSVPLYTHPIPTAEPLAYINVEERKLEWAKPIAWHTPTIAQMAKIPLYTHSAKTLTDEEILIAIKSIADDVGSYKEYENTYEDGWLDACNTVYDEVFAILRKAQNK